MSGKEKYPERNQLIRAMYAEGMAQAGIARVMGLHPQSVRSALFPEKARQSARKWHQKRYGVDDAYTEKCRAASRERARKKRGAAL